MNTPRSRPPTYCDTLSLVRADVANRIGRINESGFETALVRATNQQRQRTTFVFLALFVALGTWLVSVLAHPISDDLCPNLEQYDVFRLGLPPAINLSLCAVLVWHQHAGAQMFVRACCWSCLVVGTLAMIASPGLLPLALPGIALGCGAALLVLRNHGLEPERYRGTFVPVAHRVTLTWAMILAVADMQTLLTVIHANVWRYPLTNACTAGMVLAVVGLYRLRAWGLWLNLALNIVVAILALSGNLDGVLQPLSYMLATTAVVQAGLMIPLVRSILIGQADEHPRLLRVGGRLAQGVVVVSMIAALLLAWRGPDPESLRAFCARINHSSCTAGTSH